MEKQDMELNSMLWRMEKHDIKIGEAVSGEYRSTGQEKQDSLLAWSI